MGTNNRALPPPSPIPTGKGSRSAVDSVLSEYIDQTQIVPELSLPQNAQRWVPAEIDYRSIKFRDSEAIEKISKSISDDGVFLVSDHGGFSTGELRSILIDNQWTFALLTPDHNDRRRGGYNEKYVWSISDKKTLEKGKYAAHQQEILQILSQEMENVGTKLKEMAQELSPVVLGSRSGQPATKTKLCIYRSTYNSTQQSSIIDNDQSDDPLLLSKYGFSLLLPLQPTEFYLKAKASSFRTTTADTVIVAIGEHLQIMKPNNLHGNSVSLSIQLNYSSSSSTSRNSDGDVAQNKISLRDQIAIVIIFILLYQVFWYIISWF
nr:Gibberellin 2-beta-dioxygenase [Ipomoea batatas]